MPKESLEEFNKKIIQREEDLKIHESVLLEKLESGEYSCDTFDASTIKLLEEILLNSKNKNLVGLKVFCSVVGWIVPKMAGVGAGAIAMDEGSKYAAELTKEYLKGKMLLEVGSKEIPVQEEVVKVITPESPNLLDALKHTFNSVAGTTKTALAHISEKVQDAGIMAANYVSETFINNIAGPATEMVSKPPMAVGGFLLGAGIVGGGVSVYHAIRERSGFGFINNMIQKSNEFIEYKETSKDGGDPRLDLIAYFENASEDPKHLGHKLTIEEWLMLAGSVRSARTSILRDMTNAPLIVVDEKVKEGINKQEKIVEYIIQNQQNLAEADLELAKEILAQFGEHLEKEIDPIRQKLKYNDTLLPKIREYSKIFVKGGFNATGIPMAWKMATFGFRSTRKAVRVATLGTIH